jgi:hypothetical protein
VTFVGGAQTLIEKAVPKVGATVVAAHLALLAETHVAFVAGVEARAICVPPAKNWVKKAIMLSVRGPENVEHLCTRKQHIASACKKN